MALCIATHTHKRTSGPNAPNAEREAQPIGQLGGDGREVGEGGQGDGDGRWLKQVAYNVQRQQLQGLVVTQHHLDAGRRLLGLPPATLAAGLRDLGE